MPVSKPLVSCLTATYGRYSVLCDAVTCFCYQDYPNRELIILNNHPKKLYCDLPNIFIYNEPKYETLGDCRNRLLELARGEFVRTWDDDDLYLPWAISQGVMMIPDDKPVWKPNRSWSWHKNIDRVLLQGNVYEASWTMRTEFVKKYGYLPKSGGNEHRPLRDALQKHGGIARDEMGPSGASYVYTWGTGLDHISGTLGNPDVEQRTIRWMQKNQDTGNSEPIKLTDLTPYWQRINKTKNELIREEFKADGQSGDRESRMASVASV